MLALHQRFVDVHHMKHLVGIIEVLFKLLDIVQKFERHADGSINCLYSLKEVIEDS